MGPMRLMRALAPAMAGGGRRIVNVSSSSGKRPSRRLDASYSVTKAAQLSLSRAVRRHLWAARACSSTPWRPARSRASRGPRPAAWPTSSPRAPARRREQVLERTAPGLPLGRMGTDDEAAAVIVFLCSRARRRT